MNCQLWTTKAMDGRRELASPVANIPAFRLECGRLRAEITFDVAEVIDADKAMNMPDDADAAIAIDCGYGRYILHGTLAARFRSNTEIRNGMLQGAKLERADTP